MKKNDYISRLNLFRKGMSAREFAKICGIPESTMRNYLSGKRIIPFDVMEEVAKKLKTTHEYLASGRKLPIWDIDHDVLRAIFEEDPEIIDIEDKSGKITPVVRTYDDENEQLHFFCIHCDCYHSHGRGGPDTEFCLGRGGFAGDRNAHCFATNSPFKVNGYILEVVGKISECQHKERNPRICPNCNAYYSAALNGCECGFEGKLSSATFPKIHSLYKEHGHIKNQKSGRFIPRDITHQSVNIQTNDEPRKENAKEGEMQEIKDGMRMLAEEMKLLREAIASAGIQVPEKRETGT